MQSTATTTPLTESVYPLNCFSSLTFSSFLTSGGSKLQTFVSFPQTIYMKPKKKKTAKIKKKIFFIFYFLFFIFISFPLFFLYTHVVRVRKRVS